MRRTVLLPVLAIAVLAGGVAVVTLRSGGSCEPETSVVRTWNEEVLNAIRRDFPAPTVHSRNLYHLSALSWDIWAAYDDAATGVFVQADRGAGLSPEQIADERNEAIAYASHRLLSRRYESSVGRDESLASFNAALEAMCLDAPDEVDAASDSAAAFGLSLADQLLDGQRRDGSLEAAAYVDLSYASVNLPLPVSQSGTEMADPNRWQPLSLAEQVTQNGQVLPAGVQEFIGPNWGFVTPFALEPDPVNGLPLDPGPPPLLGVDNEAFAEAAADVVWYSSILDPLNSTTIDISPAIRGNRPLGVYESAGHDLNPVTGEPYEANPVLEADYARVVAEFWADGPDSETPPGHWNTLANEVSDALAPDGLQIDGEVVGRLEWDVKLALMLNGGLHDGAIAAWGAKARYDYARPISMIRYLGMRGELPERPGVIETITEASTGPDGAHAGLADYVGEQAVFAWTGQPLNPDAQIGRVAWRRAADWVPYQRASFVSPAFAAYVSGHSVFSRVAADVLTDFTGSAFFPGGMGTHTVEPGGLIHEAGPSDTVTLQWATYQDASDEAGESRLFGGIHVWADDLRGREMGAEVAVLAVAKANDLFG